MPLLLVRLSFQILHCSVSALAKPGRGIEAMLFWRGHCRRPARSPLQC